MARAIAGTIAFLLSLSGLVAAAEAAIQVRSTDDRVLARIGKLTCRTSGKTFEARGTAAGWRLELVIKPFAGYHRYEIRYGSFNGPANFLLRPPGGGGDRVFANGNTTDEVAARLPIGGAVLFSGSARNRKLTLNYPIVYDSSGTDPNIVRLAGSASCGR